MYIYGLVSTPGSVSTKQLLSLIIPKQVLGSGVEEHLLGEGEDADTEGTNSGDQVDHVLALVLVIDLKNTKKSKLDIKILIVDQKIQVKTNNCTCDKTFFSQAECFQSVTNLLPRLGGHAHLLDAGSGPVSDCLPPPGDHHQTRAGEQGTCDHGDCVINSSEISRG